MGLNPNINAIRKKLSTPKTFAELLEATGLAAKPLKWILLWSGQFRTVRINRVKDCWEVKP